MKILSKKIIYLISITLFWSCSNIELTVNKSNKNDHFNTNHWVTYKEPKKSKKLIASLKNIRIFNESTINYSFNKTEPDSVEIITKTGRKYIGTVVKSDFDGYFLKIGNNREIFINNQEIKIMKKLKDISSQNKIIETTETIQEEKKSFKETKAVENERKKLNLMPIFKGIGATLLFILTL